MNNCIIICGSQASGKSTITKEYVSKGYVSLNRDTEGGTIKDLLPKMENLLKDNQKIILDNTFPKVEVRKPFIELAKKFNQKIDCIIMNTSLEDAQFNAVQRMINILGKFPSPEEIKKSKHSNIFPINVLFRYRKEYEKPSLEEGFDHIETINFVRKDNPEFTGKGLFLDYDGTLRECIGGNGMYPVQESEIEIKPNRKEVIERYKANGYKIFGVSNQSGVHKGILTHQKAIELFNHTNKLLGIDIDVHFCPHQSNPISCYCRKPQIGTFVKLMMEHKLDRKQCQMVGDMTTDESFAKRAGIQYIDQAEFFK